MASFKFVKRYQLHLIDKFIKKHHIIKSPFLEVGCGTGLFLGFLQRKKFNGKGIDTSKEAIKIAKQYASGKIKVELQNIFEEQDKYNFILMLDVLEHIKNDWQCVKKIYNLLNEGGYFLLQVPSHREKYSWLDSSYGHYRRYDREELLDLLKSAGFETVEICCVGFPFVSVPEYLVGIFGRTIKRKDTSKKTMEVRTSKSGIRSPAKEKFPIIRVFDNIINFKPIRNVSYGFMDMFLKGDFGNTYIVLCRKWLSNNFVNNQTKKGKRYLKMNNTLSKGLREGVS